MQDAYYSIKEIANLIKVSYLTVYRWIKEGKLKALKIQKQYRISDEDFKNFINKNK